MKNLNKILIKNLINILCLIFICSCASYVRPTLRLGKSYNLGEINTTDIGATMVKVYNAYGYPVYMARYTFQPPLPIDCFYKGDLPDQIPPITPNQKWKAIYKSKQNYIICSNSYCKSVGIEIKPNGELANENPWVCISTVSRGRNKLSWEAPNNHLFERIEDYLVELHKGSFKAELIYTGKMHNIITISYREYIDHMARPAFYQELKYDLSEGNDITFKSLKIKILEANNKKIVFQVLDDDRLPWVPKIRQISFH